MSDERTIRVVRAVNYMAGAIKHHADEPLCADCKGYAAVVETVRETVSNLTMDTVDEKFKDMFDSACAIIMDAKVSADPVPRRKTGECVLADKRCFLKNSRKFFNECVKHS